METYGLDTYGLDTYGLDTYGLDTYGLDTYGLVTYGLDSYGLNTYVVDTYGLDTSGADTYALDTYGLDTYGLDTYSLDTYDLDTLAWTPMAWTHMQCTCTPAYTFTASAMSAPRVYFLSSSILTTPLLLRSHAAERLANTTAFVGLCAPGDERRHNFLALACQAQLQARVWSTANHQGGGGSRPGGCAAGHDTRTIRQHRAGLMCTGARRCTPVT